MALITSLLKDQTDKVAQNVYEQFEKQTGHVPEWVKVMAHCPQVLKEFTELFKVVMGEGQIEKELKWKIAYLVSKTLRGRSEITSSSSLRFMPNLFEKT